MTRIHPQARTTPRVRAEIKASSDSSAKLARRYNITKASVRKGRAREDTADRSHRPHRLSTSLSPAQEAVVVELRRLLLLPLDDLLVITREFIHAAASRSAQDRCLRRHGVNDLRALRAEMNAQGEGAAKPAKTFKDYEPGFVHVDIKYLPQMPDETEAAPVRISKLLTDNGSQFTDRFTAKGKEPSGQHHFDVRCKTLGIEHRLCPPRHPQTNGMVERFNARMSEVVAQTRFRSAAELETTPRHYLRAYNQKIPQRALDHQTPSQALKARQIKSPQLFKKRVQDLPGLDR